ncbi:MAG: radical SAM protein [Clostridia bacterium]|nr:radical SAM protein [Clostridia bacterium]
MSQSRFQNRQKLLIIPIFVPHAGCPHDCCFCNQKLISGSIREPGAAEIEKTIGSFAEAAKRYDRVEIAFYGGSFTAIEGGRQDFYLEAASKYLKRNGGFADSLRASTRPDRIDGEVIRRLKKYGLDVVELGAQSMDDNVLRLSGRGHRASDTERAAAMLKENGFVLGLQTMQGLPGADRESDVETAVRIAGLRPDFVRIYPTVVVKQTKLYEDYIRGDYTPLSVEDAVALVSRLCGIYRSSGIPVARIGLQSTDTISREGAGTEIAAGPYHEAFGQLVTSYDVRRAVKSAVDHIREDYINMNERRKLCVKRLYVVVPPERVSDATGQRRSNAETMARECGAERVTVLSKDSFDADFRRLPGQATEASAYAEAAAVKVLRCGRGAPAENKPEAPEKFGALEALEPFEAPEKSGALEAPKPFEAHKTRETPETPGEMLPVAVSVRMRFN